MLLPSYPEQDFSLILMLTPTLKTNTYIIHYKDEVIFQWQSPFCLNYTSYHQFMSSFMDNGFHVWVVTKDFDGFILFM